LTLCGCTFLKQTEVVIIIDGDEKSLLMETMSLHFGVVLA